MADATLRIVGIDATRQAFASVERNIKGLERAAAGVAAPFRAIGGLAAAAGLAAFAGAVRSAINAADDLNQVSANLGVGVERLSELKYAAAQSGLAFEDLQKGLAQLSSKIEEGSDTFRRLQIDLDGIKSPDQALRAIAERFAQMEDGAQKTALAADLFGQKLGPRFVELLSGGADGLARFADEARRLGAVVSTDTARAADQFNDSLTRLGANFDAVKISIANQFLPTLNRMLDDLNEGIRISGGFGNAILNLGTINPFKSLQGNIRSLNEELDGLLKRQKELATAGVSSAAIDGSIARARQQLEFLKGQAQRDALAGGQDFRDPRDFQARRKPGAFVPLPGEDKKSKKGAGGSKADPFGDLSESLAREKRGLQELTREQELLAQLEEKRYKSLTAAQREALVQRAREIDAVREAQRIQEEAAEAERQATDQAVRQAQEHTRELEKQREANQQILDDYAEQAEAVRRLIDPTREFKQELEDIRELQNLGFLNEEEVAKAEKILGERMRDALNKGKDGFDEFKGSAASALEDAIVNFEKLGDVARGFADDMLRIATRRGIIEPLFGAIFGSGGSGGSGMFGDFFKGLFGGSFPGFANGGSFMVGGGGGTDSQLVAFRATPGERVSVSRPGAREGGVSLVMNINGVQDVRSFERSRQQILSDMSRQLNRARTRA
jgi:uncharacterized phage infection (PIP) family protein YhgE